MFRVSHSNFQADQNLRFSMLFLGEFTAWITIGDEETPAEEYSVTEIQSENTVMAYIASSEGQRFQIGWCDNAFERPTRGRVTIDGRSMGGKIISESTYNKSVRKKGFRTNKDERRPFVFSKLEVTGEFLFCSDVTSAHVLLEDDEILSLSSTNPGEIILVIVRVRMRGTRKYDKSHAPPPAQIFNEKDVKGRDAHTTTYFLSKYIPSTPHSFLQVRSTYSRNESDSLP